MLVGFHEPTSGDAEIYGLSIKDNIAQVQQLIGVIFMYLVSLTA